MTVILAPVAKIMDTNLYTLPVTSGLDWGGWLTPHPAALKPGKDTRHPTV
jgi:hypothetical protein